MTRKLPMSESEEGRASGPVRVSDRGLVRHLELNRPEMRNPLDGAMVDALTTAVSEAADDPAVRVILITGAGKAFSAGGNLGNLTERLATRAENGGKDPIAVGNRGYGRFLQRFVQVPKVTVVAAQGSAMGGGAGLICSADISIGASNASFGFPETRIGLVPAQILPFVATRIGIRNARRLMLTGERIDGTEAHRLGVLDYLVEDTSDWDARVDEITAMIVRGAPAALMWTKKAFAWAAGEERSRDLERYLDDASDAFACQMRSEAIEGVAASREKRDPDWSRSP